MKLPQLFVYKTMLSDQKSGFKLFKVCIWRVEPLLARYTF